MEVNFNYDYLFLNNLNIDNNNDTQIYILDDNSNCISTKSQKWFINMELLEFKIPFYFSYVNLDNYYEKIYILINELKSNDSIKYHFVCKSKKTIDGFNIKPLNLYNFNTNKICLATPKLTFSFYSYSKELNTLEKLKFNYILPLELIIKYKN